MFTREAIQSINGRPVIDTEVDIMRNVKVNIIKSFALQLDQKPNEFFTEPGPKLFKFTFEVYSRDVNGQPTKRL